MYIEPQLMILQPIIFYLQNPTTYQFILFQLKIIMYANSET